MKERVKIPRRIYLQLRNDEGELLHPDDRTWCDEKIYKYDIEYRRVFKTHDTDGFYEEEEKE